MFASVCVEVSSESSAAVPRTVQSEDDAAERQEPSRALRTGDGSLAVGHENGSGLVGLRLRLVLQRCGRTRRYGHSCRQLAASGAFANVCQARDCIAPRLGVVQLGVPLCTPHRSEVMSQPTRTAPRSPGQQHPFRTTVREDTMSALTTSCSFSLSRTGWMAVKLNEKPLHWTATPVNLQFVTSLSVHGLTAERKGTGRRYVPAARI